MNFFDKVGIMFQDYGNLILTGFQNTLLIAVCATLIGIVIGTIIAAIKIVPQNNFLVKILSKIADLYVVVFRGTPIVVQLLIMYFVVITNNLPEIVTAIITFGLNSGAYVSENMRSGILAVDKGQMEAARSLGMGYGTAMFKVVLPQAIKHAIPNLGNEFIALLKETSVAGFITVRDLTKVIQGIIASTYYVVVPYIVLAAIYLVLVLFFTGILRLIERRLRKGESR